jgi:hypothetical protein
MGSVWSLPDRERLGMLLLVLVLVTTWYFGSQGGVSPDITGTVAVPTSVKLVLLKTSKDADAVTTITHFGDDQHQLHLYRTHWGGMRAKPEDLNAVDPKGNKIWTVKDEVVYGLANPVFDVGSFAGFAKWHDRDSPRAFQTGLRLSPLRLLYGTVSLPDALISNEAIGLGASVYPPPAWAGDTWSHIGAGIGRLYAYHHGESANIGYISMSFIY